MARVIFIGIKKGFVNELFKLGSTVLFVFILLHYYSSLADLVPNRWTISRNSLEFIVFFLLWGALAFVFRFIRDGILLLFSVETNKKFDQWGGGVLAIGRGLIVCSLTLFMLLLSRSDYIHKLAKTSLTRKGLLPISVKLYSGMYNGVIHKLFSEEEINDEPFEVVQIQRTYKKHARR